MVVSRRLIGRDGGEHGTRRKLECRVIRRGVWLFSHSHFWFNDSQFWLRAKKEELADIERKRMKDEGRKLKTFQPTGKEVLLVCGGRRTKKDFHVHSRVETV